MRVVKASRRNIGLPLVISAARLKEWRGYACLSGVSYDDNNGYMARLSEEGSRALHEELCLLVPKCLIKHRRTTDLIVFGKVK